MEYGKAFTFITEDENWIAKVLIGGLLFIGGNLIPIIPFLPVFGYMLDLMINVAKGESRPLPAWDNFEDKFRKGAGVFAIGIVYFLPLLLLGCCFFAAAIWAGAASSNTSGSNGNAIASAIPILYLCCFCFAVVYGLAAAMVSAAATIVYGSTGQLRDAFRFGDVLALTQRYLGDFVMMTVVIAAAGLVAGILTIITCGLGSLVASPWAMMVQYHLMGQIYRKVYPPPADTLHPAQA